jgi:hypothetical protein
VEKISTKRFREWFGIRWHSGSGLRGRSFVAEVDAPKPKNRNLLEECRVEGISGKKLVDGDLSGSNETSV